MFHFVICLSSLSFFKHDQEQGHNAVICTLNDFTWCMHTHTPTPTHTHTHTHTPTHPHTHPPSHPHPHTHTPHTHTPTPTPPTHRKYVNEQREQICLHIFKSGKTYLY